MTDPSYDMRILVRVMERIPMVIVLPIVAGSAHAQGYYDCYDVWNGPNLPNTTCVTSEGAAGTWNANCACIANVDAYDCNGIFNGTSYPGTLCQWTNDSITYRLGIWSPNCTCDNDSAYMMKDCLGVSGGHDWPGTPCIVPGSSAVGVWGHQCACEALPSDPCRADFRSVQAHRPDSLPIPYVLCIWDLSHQSAGTPTYHWDFGDGVASNERYPTHAYKDSGPYELCLTIDDGKGCTSTTCHSVSVDNDGFFNDLVAVIDHSIGFTVTVRCLKKIDLEEIRAFDGLLVKPLPGSNALNVELMNRADRAVTVALVDVDGRTVATERRRLANGRNEWPLAYPSIRAGTYLLRIQDGAKTVAQRLIKLR